MSLIDLIFPINCLNCKTSGVYICKDCVSKVGLPQLNCPECSKPSIDGFTHTKCKKPQGIDGLLSLWKYQGVIRKAILALKYKYATEIVKELQSCMVKELEKRIFLLPTRYFFTPVPIHWYRENYRGFNQSEIVGKTIAKKFNWKFIPDLIIRKKSTASQVELKGSERRKNVQDAFFLNNSYIPNSKSYILFDDVCTTGSTIKEAARVLKRNGADKVWGLTIAK